jgi:hypothetical protein
MLDGLFKHYWQNKQENKNAKDNKAGDFKNFFHGYDVLRIYFVWNDSKLGNSQETHVRGRWKRKQKWKTNNQSVILRKAIYIAFNMYKSH